MFRRRKADLPETTELPELIPGPAPARKSHSYVRRFDKEPLALLEIVALGNLAAAVR